MAPLVVAVILMSLFAGFAADRLVSGWFQRDVELRSELIFKAVEPNVQRLAPSADQAGLSALFDAVARDERILSLGLCDPQGRPYARSRNWPADMVCRSAGPQAQLRPAFERRDAETGPVLVGRFPLAVAGQPGFEVVVLHDMGYAVRRGNAAMTAVIAFVALLAAVGIVVTVSIMRLMLATWARAVVQTIDPKAPVRHEQDIVPELRPVVREVRQTLRDIDFGRFRAPSIRIQWSPEILQEAIRRELPGSEVLVLSNREPYLHQRRDGEIVVQRPASGVVTALEPIIRACRGVWIAHGSGSADRDVVDAADHVAVPPGDPSYTLRRVWLTEEEEEGYYYRFANEGLWPLCHIAFVRPVFRREDWDMYRAVNERFADTVAEEARTPNPIVFVQDYHFALAPRMIRARLPEATIVTFWHIPWPNSEMFSICPWREEILDGLLGSSILGFHTRFHCNNFLDSVDRFMESQIDRELSTVTTGGEPTLINAYPISIEWPPRTLAGAPPPQECRRRLIERYNLPHDALIGVGVERYDYTKGIPDRLRAVALLLERHPEWIGRFVFVQVAAPTRSKLDAYRQIATETEHVAADVNARFGRGGWQPIVLVPRHHEPEEVMELFRAADFGVVTSLHDGMNLVAKEFVAARDDERGALVLSTFAGASRELLEALIVNPYDIDTLAETLDEASRMPEEEQRDRMRLMRELVRDNNVYHWAGSMLLEAARMRRRSDIRKGVGT